MVGGSSLGVLKRGRREEPFLRRRVEGEIY